MKVTFVSSLPYGGPVEQAINLGRSLVSMGVDLAAVCADDRVAHRFEAAGAATAVMPLRHQLDARTARRIVRFASGSDVVHAHDRRSGLWTRLGRRPRRDAIRVYTFYGLPTPYLPPPVGAQRPGLRARVAYAGIDRALCARVDAVITASHAMADLVARRLGYPRERLVVVPTGVERRPPHRSEGSLVGTLCALEPVKGLEVFLAAAALIAERRPDVRFALYGKGSQEGRLASLARELGISERVQLPGYVPADSALSRLSVFVLSSWMENSPTALLEAMSSGVPAVATRVGGVPEIAVDGTAQLVEAGDVEGLSAAIGRLLDDRELSRRQAEAARSRVLEHFTAEASASATLALYEELLQTRKRQ